MLPSALSWACSMIPPPGGFHHPGFVVTAGLFEYVIIAPELKQSSVPIVELRLVIVQASSQYAGVWSPYFLRLERPLLLARPGRLRPRSLPQPRGAASPHTQKHSQGLRKAALVSSSVTVTWTVCFTVASSINFSTLSTTVGSAGCVVFQTT